MEISETYATQERINKEAEKIKRQLIGGMLYGRVIGESDTNAIILAAYLLGKQEQVKEDLTDFKRVFEIE